MSGGGQVGIDPDRTRALARQVATAAEFWEFLTLDLPATLAIAEMDDNGSASLAAEIDEELRLLKGLLEAKADEIEGVDGGYIGYADILGDLWTSLQDDVGEGIDFDEEVAAGTGGVPMSPSVAAATVAQWMRNRGIDSLMEIGELDDIAGDEGVPAWVRAAAQYLVSSNAQLTAGMRENGTLSRITPDSLDEFVATNVTLALLARRFDDIAGDDGGIDEDDIERALRSDDFGSADKALIEKLYDSGLGAQLRSQQALSLLLISRGVLIERPDLGRDYLDAASADPHHYFGGSEWEHESMATAWLESMLAGTGDPAEQATVVLQYASLFQATKIPASGPLDLVHDLLDTLSFVDPISITDALNAGIYFLEGDNLNAGLSAGGILIPFAGGKALRIGSDVIETLVRGGRLVGDDLLINAARTGQLTDEMIGTAVREVAVKFGDEAAQAVRRYLDDIGDVAADGFKQKAKANSSTLAARLTRHVEPRPVGFEAHHIVAGNSGAVARAREKLEEFGIDINSADNGVFLPRDSTVPNPDGRAVHPRGVSGNRYDKWVADQFDDVTNRAQAIAKLDQIEQILRNPPDPLPW